MIAVGLSVSGVLSSTPLWAAEFSVQPSVGVSTEYNDNLLMTSQPHNSVWGLDLWPRIKLARRTEVSEIRFDGRADIRRYSGHSALNTDDYDLELTSHYNTEVSQWGVNAGVLRDTTLTGELGSGGLIGGFRTRRQTLTVNPSWTHQFDALNSLQVSYNMSDVRYPGSTSYSNYRYQEVDASWVRQWDAKTRATFTVLDSKFDSGQSQSKTNTLGIQAGITRSFSESSRGTLTAGWRSSKGSALVTVPVPVPGYPFPDFYQRALVTQHSSSTGALISATFEQQFERGKATASLSRNLSPGGLGVLYQADQFQLDVSRRLTPKMDADIEFIAGRNTAAQGGATSSDRKFYSFTPSLRWWLTEWWRLEANYRYRWQKYDTSPQSAASNAVSVSLIYTWPKTSVSQ